MALDYFKAYHRYLKAMSNLSDSECGRLFRSLLQYSEGDTLINLKGRESVAFDFIAAEIDVEAEKYKEMCERNKANGSQNKRPLPTATEKKKEKKKEKNQKKEENKKENTPYSPPEGERDFASFWDAYPRKVGKQRAAKAFANVKAPIDVLLKALEQQKRTEQWQNEQYIPHPTTWLNQGRWEDEITTLPAEEEVTPKPRRFAMDEDGNVWPAEECFLDEFGKVRHKEV